MQHDFSADIDAIDRIASVPTILDVACRITGMGLAAVARVTDEHWIACKVLDNIDFGLVAGGELDIAATFCNVVRQSREVVVIDNVATDPVYAGHPIPAQYGFQSYISMPIIRRDGSFFGTLCALDRHPARLRNPEILGMFRLFAELIATHLDDRDLLLQTRAELNDERRTADLREQFMAVVGHDMRNPLASLDAGAKLLLKTPLDARSTEILTMMRGSIARMNELIGNVLDLARARLGGGIELEVDAGPLHPALEQVIAELRIAHPGRTIEVALDFLDPVPADHRRIAQLLSNLLQNALAHGDPNQPIAVGASRHAGRFDLWVSNGGPPIPPEAAAQLFEPFFRFQAHPGKEGLGLGLYIAAQIARAHGGTLTLASTPAQTRFTFSMPVD